MKRCPQCEFIYEDDQSLCDMDGVLLVLDSRTLPNVQALETVPARVQPRRNRAVPAFATLILALVLGMVYFVSTRRSAVPTTTDSPASATAPVAVPTPEAQPSESPKEEVKEAKPATEKQPSLAPAKKPAPKMASTPQAKIRVEPKKDESKVGSILKKTGRILKKPFKF